MRRRVAHMITYTITGGRLSESELQYYLDRAVEQHPGTDHINIDIDGDFVNVAYFVRPFERIRRITGYLVGTLDRFNDAKRAEVGDRVKHSFDITDEDRFNN